MSEETISNSNGFKVFPEGQKIHLCDEDKEVLCGADKNFRNKGITITASGGEISHFCPETVVKSEKHVCNNCLSISSEVNNERGT